MADAWTGTFVVGAMRCSYAAIVRAFGEPAENDGDDAEWQLTFPSDAGPTYATIYPCPDMGPRWRRPVRAVRVWHIGGFGPAAMPPVRSLNQRVSLYCG